MDDNTLYLNEFIVQFGGDVCSCCDLEYPDDESKYEFTNLYNLMEDFLNFRLRAKNSLI